jgi:hypothetical protein
MLYRIKYICDEVDGFVREIKIDSDSSFLDLCKVILKSCNYQEFLYHWQCHKACW